MLFGRFPVLGVWIGLIITTFRSFLFEIPSCQELLGLGEINTTTTSFLSSRLVGSSADMFRGIFVDIRVE